MLPTATHVDLCENKLLARLNSTGSFKTISDERDLSCGLVNFSPWPSSSLSHALGVLPVQSGNLFVFSCLTAFLL